MRPRAETGARPSQGAGARFTKALPQKASRVDLPWLRSFGINHGVGGDRLVWLRGPARIGSVCGGTALLLSSLALPVGSVLRVAASSGAVLMAVALVGAALAKGFGSTKGVWRRFWVLLGVGTLLWFSGMTVQNGSRLLALASPDSISAMVQALAHIASYLVLFGALAWLVKRVRQEMVVVDLLDTLSVMMGSGLLLWCAFVNPSDYVGAEGLKALASLLRPMGDLGLAFLALRVLTTVRPPFASFLACSILLLLMFDGTRLALRMGEPQAFGGWSELYWIMGIALLGYATLRGQDRSTLSQNSPRFGRLGMLLFWLGPLSPPLQYGVVLLWGMLRPPLPGYVLLCGAVLLLVFAVRTYAANHAADLLTIKHKALTKRTEQSRILGELHDTVKQNIRGVSMMIEACVHAQKRGDAASAREFLNRSLNMSREAGYQLSKPLDELRLSYKDEAVGATALFKERFEKFGKDFSLEAHEDLRAPLEMLDTSEIAVAHRVCIEASWNAVKHSNASNLWLESRLEGANFVIGLRDDGRGFRLQENSEGLGLRFMRSRSEEVGADLNLITAPGKGTIVQLRFGKR